MFDSVILTFIVLVFSCACFYKDFLGTSLLVLQTCVICFVFMLIVTMTVKNLESTHCTITCDESTPICKLDCSFPIDMRNGITTI